MYKGVHLSDASSGALPLLVDVGWRIAPELYVGVYGQYAPVFLKTYALTCPSGSSCTAQDWRFGVEAVKAELGVGVAYIESQQHSVLSLYLSVRVLRRGGRRFVL